MSANGERRQSTAGPWVVYSQSEDEGWPEHLGWEGCIRSTTDKDADWVAQSIYNPADAVLIAAAPHLLHALEVIAQSCSAAVSTTGGSFADLLSIESIARHAVREATVPNGGRGQ